MYTGLGFSLWLDEEETERKQQREADVYHDIKKVQERVFETVTAIQKKGGMTLGQIAEKMGRTEEELQQFLKQYKILDAVENNLNVILRDLK
jgi:phage antirepressor YoqD-like protein